MFALAVLTLGACSPGGTGKDNDRPAEIADSGRDTAPETTTETGDSGDSDSAHDTGPLPCVDAPVVDAGPDQTVPAGTREVQLAGSASGGCGSYVFDWAIQALPAGSTTSSSDIHDPGDPDALLMIDAAGSYVLSLQAYDGASWSTPDLVVIDAE